MAISTNFTQREFTSKDIAESIGRVQRVFDGDYGRLPINEENVPIGSVTAVAEKVAVSFRGNRNNTWEVIECGDIMTDSLRHVGFKGQVHRGINHSFQKIRKEVLSKVQECLSEGQLENFIIEGHSRGTGIAALIAAFMRKKFPTSSISVLTYSPMAIFDENGAQNYTTLIGKENHLSFVAQGDFLPPLFEKVGFYHVGRKIEFNPDASHFYRSNVAENHYPYLTTNKMLALPVKLMLGAKGWNAHMLETYRDIAPTLI